MRLKNGQTIAKIGSKESSSGGGSEILRKIWHGSLITKNKILSKIPIVSQSSGTNLYHSLIYHKIPIIG